MRCASCSEEAIIDKPARCKTHFLEGFEARVAKTVVDHDLIPKGAKVCVAVSGGKDSLSTLHILKRLGYAVSALAIDEGIDGYRAHTIEDLERFCTEHKIELRIVSFEEAFGKKLDKMLEKPEMHPCTVCGTFRRYLLNKHAHGYDVVATGHNADDEAQSVLMNLFRANTFFSRPGPKTGRPENGLVQRVKPLYFCTEKEIMTYALLNNITVGFNECPYVPQSYRDLIRSTLNAHAIRHPDVRQQILRRFLKIKTLLPLDQNKPSACYICGEPSQDKTCAACRLRAAL